jgi:hypothetical protein
MPYHHPIARTASVIWWGIYIGSLGASLGALAGLVLRRARPAEENKFCCPCTHRGTSHAESAPGDVLRQGAEFVVGDRLTKAIVSDGFRTCPLSRSSVLSSRASSRW